MATTKTAGRKTSRTDTGESTNLTYTATSIAKYLGVANPQIGRWRERVFEIWEFCQDSLVEDPKANNLKYTETGKRAFELYQQNCCNRIPKRSEDNLILRDENGKVLVVDNPNYTPWKEYRDRIWKEQNWNQAQPVDVAITYAPQEQVSLAALDTEDSAISEVDDFGDGLGGFLDKIAQAGLEIGQEAGAAFSENVVAGFKQTTSSTMGKLGKTLESRGKKARSGKGRG